jgi:hypothetical protein
MIVMLAMLAVAVSDDPKPPPSELGLDPFYQKCLMARGIPIVSSAKVDDRAIKEAKRIVEAMLGKRPELAKPMVERKLRVAVMAQTEQTLDIPEHSDLQKAFPSTDWNKRARGLGATVARPAVSCGAENLLGLTGDRYRGESILIHEFAHTVLNFGLEPLEPAYRRKLEAAFKASKDTVWKNTYAATNIDEYWAEGVQSWFDCNQKGPAGGNGVHNEIWNRTELKDKDRQLYDLLEKVFVTDSIWRDPAKNLPSTN